MNYPRFKAIYRSKDGKEFLHVKYATKMSDWKTIKVNPLDWDLVVKELIYSVQEDLNEDQLCEGDIITDNQQALAAMGLSKWEISFDKDCLGIAGSLGFMPLRKLDCSKLKIVGNKYEKTTDTNQSSKY